MLFCVFVSLILILINNNLSLQIPQDIKFQANQIDIVRILGKIDMEVDQTSLEEAQNEFDKLDTLNDGKVFMQWNPLKKNNRATYIRIFEARIPGGTRCYLKEYLPIGLPFGKRELVCTRKLTAKWNYEILEENKKSNQENKDEINEPTSTTNYFIPSISTFPILLGSLRPDERIESSTFQTLWKEKFPRAIPPEAGNLWLVFQWDEFSFKSLRKYPSLPQIIEGLDYFRKDERDRKRWLFIRKIIRKCVLALDFIHKNEFCHNALSSESIWLSTSNQLQIGQLEVKITDLGID
jgi:hypothetical protein